MKPDVRLLMMLRTWKTESLIYALASIAAMRLLVHHIHPTRVQHQQRSYDRV